MKQILLMRHAKSNWDHPDLTDFERPLAQRGMKDAPRMGAYLKEIDTVPDQLISSTAVRAKQTTEEVSKKWSFKEGQVLWNEDLYYGGVMDYLAAIQAASDEISRLMLIGHNPLMESTAAILASGSQSGVVRMPTAALICLESYASHWSSVSPGSCQIRWMMIPKVLKMM